MTVTLSIKNQRAHSLAVELSSLTKKSITDAVIEELQRGVERERKASSPKMEQERLVEKLMAIGRRAALLPDLDTRDINDILYDEHGLPK